MKLLKLLHFTELFEVVGREIARLPKIVLLLFGQSAIDDVESCALFANVTNTAAVL